MEGRKATIAVIDDDPILRETLESLLQCAGYGVEQYASAADFCAAASLTASSCLLVDIELGATSGIDLARKLAANGFSFPIIFMSGSNNEEYRRDAIALGCRAYLRKPFRFHELTAEISKAIDLEPRA